MQDSPSKLELLRALSVFLKEDIRPALSDKSLQFRTLIAANLARIVADEIQAEEGEDHKELAGLKNLIPDYLEAGELSGEARKTAIKELRLELSKRIRSGHATDKSKVFDFLKEDLKAKLMIVNPRFSTELEIE